MTDATGLKAEAALARATARDAKAALTPREIAPPGPEELAEAMGVRQATADEELKAMRITAMDGPLVAVDAENFTKRGADALAPGALLAGLFAASLGRSFAAPTEAATKAWPAPPPVALPAAAPTTGRVVIFRSLGYAYAWQGVHDHAALVTHVDKNGGVFLHVFPAFHAPFPAGPVPHEAEARPTAPAAWLWPPRA